VLQGLDATVALDLPGFEPHSLPLQAGDKLVVTVSGDDARAALYSADGERRQSLQLTASAARRSQQAAWDRIFVGVDFATPRQAPVSSCTPGFP
jgi:hypothetical protein